MEAVGAVASIVAIIDLSAKVASLCCRYATAVNNARSDIERLQQEVSLLKATFEGAMQLAETPNDLRFQTSKRLRDGLGGCSLQLKELEAVLEKWLSPGNTRKMMNWFNLRPLKWPFESKDVGGIIKTFEQHRDTMCGGLNIDQTYEGLILYLQHAGPRHEPEDDPFESRNRERCSIRLSRWRARCAPPSQP
jgi:hypothetical protein